MAAWFLQVLYSGSDMSWMWILPHDSSWSLLYFWGTHWPPYSGIWLHCLAASPIDKEGQQFNLLVAINAPFQIAHNPVTNNEVVTAEECDFCKCTTKDLNHRDYPFCLRQVATRYGISRGQFDPSISRVSIVCAESPMDDPDVTAQLWQDILHHYK